MVDEEKKPFNLLGESGFLFWSALILLAVGLPFITFVVGKASGVGVFAPAIHKCDLYSEANAKNRAGQQEDVDQKDEVDQKESPGQKKTEVLKRKGAQTKEIDQVEGIGCSVHFIGLTWLSIISCAALFGALGVMLSLVLRRKVDERLLNLTMPKILLVVYGVGSIFAVLLLALFIAGFLGGDLFPKFEATSWLDINFRLKDWARLIIWSFIAGFSERLVPGLFDQLIERALKAR
jgi:hypothetical protein